MKRRATMSEHRNGPRRNSVNRATVFLKRPVAERLNCVPPGSTQTIHELRKSFYLDVTNWRLRREGLAGARRMLDIVKLIPDEFIEGAEAMLTAHMTKTVVERLL